MDDLQDRLVRVGLVVLADYGFALAGGYALQAHGLVERMSEDVDLFTDRWDAGGFAQAVDALAAAYRELGFEVFVDLRAETFARLRVSDQSRGGMATVDLAADGRASPPVGLAIGPVLAERDAVASKVAAVFSRGEARDYLDLAGVLASGRYSRQQLIELGAQADAGFDTEVFARALAAVDRFPDSEFARYGIAAGRIASVRETMREWSQALLEPVAATRDRRPTQSPDPHLRGKGHDRGQSPLSHDPARDLPGLEGPSIGL